MHWLMYLPELFAALGATLTLVFSVLFKSGNRIMAAVCFLLAIACGVICHIIGSRFDLYSDKGLKRVRWLGILAVIVVAGTILSSLII